VRRATKVGGQARSLSQPKSGAPFWVVYDQTAVDNLQIVDEWGARGRALIKMAPYLAMEATRQNLAGLIPKSAAWRSYRRAIRTAMVGSGAYAVYVRPARARTIDGKKEVLYIRPRRSRLQPVSEAVEILAKYNPWTLSMLPYSPKRNEAVTVTRRVSARELKSIEKQRQQDQPAWRKEFLDAGVTLPARAAPVQKLDTKVVSDVAFAGMRLEFGYGGVKRVPHWKPAVRAATQTVLRRLSQDPRFTGLMTSKSSVWKKWPPVVEGQLSLADLKKFAKFQRRVGAGL
jgi:hypothetical protein